MQTILSTAVVPTNLRRDIEGDLQHRCDAVSAEGEFPCPPWAEARPRSSRPKRQSAVCSCAPVKSASLSYSVARVANGAGVIGARR